MSRRLLKTSADVRPRFFRVDRETALSRLPATYETALRLRNAGLDDAGVASQLQIPLEAVGPLIHLAEAKLARLIAGSEQVTRDLPKGD